MLARLSARLSALRK